MTSRRSFMKVVAGVPLLAVSACLERAPITREEPKVTNYDEDGSNLLLEGKTMLVEVSFLDAVKNLNGELPVRIEPETSGGNELRELQPLYFYAAGDWNFRAFLTAPLDVVEGAYLANLSAMREAGGVKWDLKYFIRRGNYREAVLKVDKSFSEPSPAVVARMKYDFETMINIYKRRTPRRWFDPFIPPVDGPDKDNFGDKRTYNQTKRARHAGLDYTAPLDTPVAAINDGVVAFSGEQWTPGETVCIDHGGGVFSKYMHLSKRLVHESATVRRGEVIGLSGKSGGQKPLPHLHLDIVVNGVRVDPKDFMRTAAALVALESQERSNPDSR